MKEHIHLASGKRLLRGARPTPRHRLLAARPHKIVGATPTLWYWIPKTLSMWLNDQDGDCVTAEEAFAKATSGILIADATVQTWASANGVLNGADLNQVLGLMQSAGFVQDSNTYDDGSYAAVDYSTESVLQNAIAQGPVKIGIDADALPSTAGNQQGWYATGGTPGQFSNEDHCVSLAGYGTAGDLFTALNVQLPAALTATTAGYLLFTWSTIGFVDHAWIMSTCGEAWLRTPTTKTVGNGTPAPDVVLTPTPSPPPTPTPTPTPVPSTDPTITGGTFSFSDGTTQTVEVAPTGTRAAVEQLTSLYGKKKATYQLPMDCSTQ